MSFATVDGGDLRACLHALTPDDLSQRLKGPGRARQVFRALAAGHDPFSQGVLPDGLRLRLAEAVDDTATRVAAVSRAADGTTKLAISLHDQAIVECVLIPERSGTQPNERATLCVSSQVGCVRGCRFCVTATMGLVRNLSVAEIVAQVALGLRQARRDGWRLRNLVFMGMGEPLDNAAGVQKALSILSDHRGFGFAPKHITVSTVGPRLSAVARLKDWPTRLAWSLHAARPEVRQRIVPPPHPPLTELVRALGEVCLEVRHPLFVEMTLMDGVNDQPEDMAAAGRLLADFPTEVRFNLIAMNPGRTDFRPSPRVIECRDQLQAGGYFCSVRRPRGLDAAAACGQLATLTRSGATRLGS